MIICYKLVAVFLCILGKYDGEIQKIKDHYEDLKRLNTASILGSLYSKDVITSEQKETIECIALDSGKMDYLLQHIIIKSLQSKIIKTFKNFLLVLEESDDNLMETVAQRIGIRMSLQ